MKTQPYNYTALQSNFQLNVNQKLKRCIQDTIKYLQWSLFAKIIDG